MFQSVYLTITGYDEKTGLFTLDYPNQEVRATLQKYLLGKPHNFDISYAEEPIQTKAQ